MNRAIDYINDHLKESIDLNTLAEVSNISKYHFHRIFKAHIGESVAAYVTRIRLERAAQHLQTSKISLIEIAARVGYRSQHSLSKAFKKQFGMAPSKFRKMEIYAPTPNDHGQAKVGELDPVIRTVGNFYLVYTRIIAKYGCSKEYDQAWYRLLEYAQEKGVLNDRTEYLGLSFDDPAITKDEQCRFYACITVEEPLKPEGEFGSLSVEGGKYAIFTHKGPYSGLHGLYQSICFDWIPKNAITFGKGISFEKYVNSPDEVSPGELITEVFIPIQ